jgi:hypothetical protein
MNVNKHTLKEFFSSEWKVFLLVCGLFSLWVFGAKAYHRHKANQLIRQLEWMEPLAKEEKDFIHSLDLTTTKQLVQYVKYHQEKPLTPGQEKWLTLMLQFYQETDPNSPRCKELRQFLKNKQKTQESR